MRPNKRLHFIAFAFCLAQGFPVSAPAQQNLDSLHWLAGHWIHVDGTVTQEEYWMQPLGSVMPGIHRSVRANGKTFFEYLRITQSNGSLVYLARPGGGDETAFHSDSLSEGFVRFVNPGHDYPQRIQYNIVDQTILVATISDLGGGRQHIWRFMRRTY